jgi:hypothetical protein
LRNFLIFVVVAVIAVWYFRKGAHEAATVRPSGDANAGSRGAGCLSAAEGANRSLSEATRILLSMPVDASKWSEAESGVSSAIASAESACSGGETEAERAGMESARDALALMRTTLQEGSKAALGAGGFQGAMRQEAIDNRLASARGKLGLR